MIADALRAEIERYANRMPLHNPLFRCATDGLLGSRDMVAYLANVHYLVLHTPIHLSRAEARARSIGDAALARHFVRKRGEEAGHDAWAVRDIARLSAQAEVPASADVLPSMKALVEFIAMTIDEDPALYLSYILFSEYLIVLLGPEWLELLEERCGIARSSMTVIGNHAELDREHVQEALEEIDALVGDPRKLKRMRQVLEQAIVHFDQFCIELTQEHRGHDEPASNAARHVSAA